MTRTLDEESLVAACRSGDTEAFGILVNRYQDRLYSTILRLTGNRDDANELLQETFMRAYLKLGRFRGGSQFFTWIYRIAVNLTISHRRRVLGKGHQPHQTIELRFDPTDDSSQPLPLDLMEKEEVHALVQRALDALQSDHRTVLVLKEFDGLRYEEIAEILNIPIGTVRSRLYRARAELRLHLERLFPEVQTVQVARSHQE